MTTEIPSTYNPGFVARFLVLWRCRRGGGVFYLWREGLGVGAGVGLGSYEPDSCINLCCSVAPTSFEVNECSGPMAGGQSESAAAQHRVVCIQPLCSVCRRSAAGTSWSLQPHFFSFFFYLPASVACKGVFRQAACFPLIVNPGS